MTSAQEEALKWLRERNGTGVFMRDGVLLAAGQRAPHMRSTWNALNDLGKVSIFERRVTVVGAA